MKIYDVATYGAVGDGKANDAKAIQAAIDDCTANGGGKVILEDLSLYYLERDKYIEIQKEEGENL